MILAWGFSWGYSRVSGKAIVTWWFEWNQRIHFQGCSLRWLISSVGSCWAPSALFDVGCLCVLTTLVWLPPEKVTQENKGWSIPGSTEALNARPVPGVTWVWLLLPAAQDILDSCPFPRCGFPASLPFCWASPGFPVYLLITARTSGYCQLADANTDKALITSFAFIMHS